MIRRPLAFLLVGACAALVHLAAVYLLVEFAGLLPAQANVLAFMLAFAVSYLGQRRFTFGDAAPWQSSVWRWGMVSVLGFVLNQFLFTQALQRLPNQPYLLSLAVVTLLVAAISFLLGKVWAFAEFSR
jgi:putative flippase GtrA